MKDLGKLFDEVELLILRADICTVLYRFGSTGVVQSLARAAELLGLVPVFPVRNITNFTSGSESGGAKAPVFKDCVLVKKYEECVPKACEMPLTILLGTQQWAMSSGR